MNQSSSNDRSSRVIGRILNTSKITNMIEARFRDRRNVLRKAEITVTVETQDVGMNEKWKNNTFRQMNCRVTDFVELARKTNEMKLGFFQN